MEFNVFNRASAILIWITAMLFVISYAEKLYLTNNQPPSPVSPNQSESENDKTRCDPIEPDYDIRELPDILQPDIFTQVDPLRYLFDKFMKLPSMGVTTLEFELKKISENKQVVSQCYIPYVKAVSSLLRCWSELYNVKHYIEGIQSRRLSNTIGYTSLPSLISPSSELHALLSDDTFSDPHIPLLIFHKLLDLPNDIIQKIRIQLQSFVDETKWWRNKSIPKWYIWLANSVRNIIRNDAEFDQLKRDLSEIQRISMSNQSLSTDSTTIT